MGLSASQGRLLLLTQRKNDLEFQAQKISQQRLVLSQQLDEISREYENATSNRQMQIAVNGADGQVYNKNLTYALLISGTQGLNSGKTGIQASSKLATDYSASSSFRLVNNDGAIVVADESEIPTFVSTTNSDKPKTISSETSGVGDNLAKFMNDNKDKKKTITQGKWTDPNGKSHNVFKVTYEDGGAKSCKLFDADTGELLLDACDPELQLEKFDDNTEEYVMSNIQNGNITITRKYKSITSYGETPEKDSNGVYTVNGQKYVVDPKLLKGGVGPNYLQDCLRNGKYMIQKGYNNIDENQFVWEDVSWDAVPAITDHYYTEDDDMAKVKYDRMQNEIQSQDKKLELELDNIETQRKAVTTEMDSVEKVIQDNIEKTFKTFA